MESEVKSTGKFALNYGIILGLILVIIIAVMYVTNMLIEGVQWPMVIYYVLFPVFLIYVISQFKKANNGILSLVDALKVGIVTAILSALVYGVFSLVLYYVVDPDLNAKLMEVTREKLYENPRMTEEAVETTMEMAKKFSSPIAGVAIWTALSAILGLIYSLIGGLVMKKEA